MTEREDVVRLVRTLAVYPVLPPAEALPPNDEAFQSTLADLARGEGSSHASVLRRVSTASAIPVDELGRRAQFLLACFLLPTSGTHYEALGLATDATTREIRKRWTVLIRRYHPDRLGGAGGRSDWLDEQARRLIAAYQTLKDPALRQQYDAQLRGDVARRPAVISNWAELPVTRFKGAPRRRWVPAGIAAVGIAAGVWAYTRPAPGPLPNAPLPAAPKLLEAWGGSDPSETAEPARSATVATSPGQAGPLGARPNATATRPVARLTSSPVGTTGTAPTGTSAGVSAAAATPSADRVPSSGEYEDAR